MYKRVCSFALVICLSVCLFLVPVGAVSVVGSFGANLTLGNYVVSVTIPRAGRKDPVHTETFTSVDRLSTSWTNISEVVYDVSSFEGDVSGTVGVYLSWSATSNVPIESFNGSLPSYSGRYSPADTASYGFPIEVSTFNFNTGVTGEYLFDGYQLKGRIEDVDTLTALSINSTSSGISGVFAEPFTGDFVKKWYIPSASIIATATTAELESLEGIADEIAAGNAIAQAMYGDIMQALNSINDDTGIVASYIEDMFSYVVSINTATSGIYQLCASYLSNLASIAQSAENIEEELELFHGDFITKMDLLLGTIASESDDIQATMDRIYAQLIAWLETNFQEAINPEFNQSNSDLSTGIQNNEAIEQEWTGSLSETWADMQLDSYEFDGDFSNGFMWVSAWFSTFYQALGIYGQIFILPLIIGICKLLLGYFRNGGTGHGGGSPPVSGGGNHLALPK